MTRTKLGRNKSAAMLLSRVKPTVMDLSGVLVYDAFLLMCLVCYYMFLRNPLSSVRAPRLIISGLTAAGMLAMVPAFHPPNQQKDTLHGLHISGNVILAVMCVLDWCFTRTSEYPASMQYFFTDMYRSLCSGRHRRLSTPSTTIAKQPQALPDVSNHHTNSWMLSPQCQLAVCQLRKYMRQWLTYDILLSILTHVNVRNVSQLSWLGRCCYSFASGTLLLTLIRIFFETLLTACSLVSYKAAVRLPVFFNGPFKATSLTDLWGERWHQAFRYYFIKLASAMVKPVLSAVRSHCPSKAALLALKDLERVLMVLAVFFLSGVMHETMTWCLYGHVTGYHMLFFLLHGIMVVFEKAVCVHAPAVAYAIPPWLGNLLTLGFFFVTCPLFMEPWLAHGFVSTLWQPFISTKPLVHAGMGQFGTSHGCSDGGTVAGHVLGAGCVSVLN